MPFAGSGGGGGGGGVVIAAAGEEEAEEDVSTLSIPIFFVVFFALSLSLSLVATLESLHNANDVYRTHNIYAPSGDAASTADTTMMSGTLATGPPLAPAATTTTPVPVVIPASEPKCVHSPEQNPTATVTETIHAHASSEATLERVSALESKVASLEAKVLDLLVRLDEVSSCVCVGSRSSTSSTTPEQQEQQREQTAAGASSSSSSSPVPSNDVTTFEDSQHLSNAADTASMTAPLPQPAVANVASATREGPKVQDASSSSSPAADIATVVEEEEGDAGGALPGLEEQQRHSIEHPEGYRPVNCSCMIGTGTGMGSRVEG